MDVLYATADGPRWSPDIVHLHTARRVKPLGAANKPEVSSSTSTPVMTNPRFSSSSILPLAKKPRTNITKAKNDEPRISPPANFNDYTYRRSRRIYNKVVTEYPVKVRYVQKEDDPMSRLLRASNFQFRSLDPESKEIFLGCLGLQPNPACMRPNGAMCCTWYKKEPTAPRAQHRKQSISSCRRSERTCKCGQGYLEIPFEELLTEGFMIYPHDLICADCS